jgi:D-inositol-3-phosphate glycosyltransferase
MSSPYTCRVAMIEPVGSHGGMDYYDSGLCQGLHAAGLQVALYTCDGTVLKGKISFLMKPFFRGIWGKDNVVLRGVRYIIGLIHSIFDARVNSTDIVHFHLFHIGILEFFGVFLAKIFFMKVILTIHDVEAFFNSSKSQLFKKITYYLADHFIVHNSISMNELVDNDFVSKFKVSIIPHGSYLGLIPDLLEKKQAKLKLGVNENDKIVLFFGQIKEVKGLDVLINGFSQAFSGMTNIKLVIAGKVWKDDFDKYESLIRKNKIHSQCIMHIRYIHDSEVPIYYGAADLIVLPYRKIYQSGVLLMSMSYGVPILASNIPGMTEIINNGDNGFLFDSNDSCDLSVKLKSILANQSLLDSVSCNSIVDMKKNFDWNIIGLETANVYKAIIKGQANVC